MARRKKVLLFAPELVLLVKNGTKTLTYRLGDDKMGFLVIGDRIQAQDSSTNEVFAELEITAKHHTTFGELPTDQPGNVTHGSKEDQRTAFKGYYGKDILDEERVLVLGFKVIPRLDDYL